MSGLNRFDANSRVGIGEAAHDDRGEWLSFAEASGSERQNSQGLYPKIARHG